MTPPPVCVAAVLAVVGVLALLALAAPWAAGEHAQRSRLQATTVLGATPADHEPQ